MDVTLLIDISGISKVLSIINSIDPSDFSKEDKIIPVITLTVYFGSDKWDGPRSLKDMFPEDIDEEVLSKVDDYHLHLIVPADVKYTQSCI